MYLNYLFPTDHIYYLEALMASTSKTVRGERYNNYGDVPTYARDYLFYLKNVRNLSSRTVDAYYIDLRGFFRFLVSYKNLSDLPIDEINPVGLSLDIVASLTLSDIYIYLNYANDERQNNATTRSRKISSLKGFYKHLNKNAIIENNPTEYLEAPKIKKRLPVYLNVEESVGLLENIDGKNQVRNFAIITIFLNCGLRLSELVGMNLNDINGSVLRVVGKGNKERLIHLNQSCIDALVEYLKIRPKDLNDPDAKKAVFISRNGRRISRRMVEVLVDKHLQQSGLDKTIYSPHKLRHTAATLMHQEGVDIRVLQEILGHSNLGTTQIYTHLADKEITEALDSNPLNKKIKKKQ